MTRFQSLRSFLTSAVLLTSHAKLTLATCYEPNGTIIQDDTSCDPSASASYCCGTGWTCLSDGICLIEEQGSTFYYRGSCTDESWASQECPSFCLEFNTNSSIPMAKCNRSDGQDWYCCEGDDSCDCDTGMNAVKLGGSQPTTVTVIGSATWPGKGSTSQMSSPTSTSASATSTIGGAGASASPTTSGSGTGASGGAGASASPTSASGTSTKKPSSTSNTSTASASASESSSSSHTAVAAGVGGGIGGVAAIGLIGALYYFFRRRPSHDATDIKSIEHNAAGTDSQPSTSKGFSNVPVSEVDGQSMVHEAPANNMASYAAQQQKNHDQHAQTNYGLMPPVELDASYQNSHAASMHNASEMDGESVYSPAPTSGISPLTPQAGLVHRMA